MATWVTHLIIADSVLNEISALCKHEFCVGNIAPDCNIENEDWTSFTPSRETTHWMSGKTKDVSDCDRFLNDYIKKRTIKSDEEESFLLGYYSHLITDAAFQKFIRDEQRVRSSWGRIRSHYELRQKAVGMSENWDSVKMLINKSERMKDIYSLEKYYLDSHTNSGYLTEILPLESFPDYIDYLPVGAIPRKIKIMGYIPQKATSKYPYICISKEEYNSFLENTAKIVTNAILAYKNK